ncbi:MAG: flippase [Polaromonas sp.]|nr:flippase [Polaromonas sp.]
MAMIRNVAWTLAGLGLPLLVGAAALPFLIARIGVESVGILTLVWALIGYFSLFDFGLGRALTQQISVNLTSDRLHHVPSLAKSGVLFTLCTGVLGGLLLAALSSPMAHRWLGVSAALQDSAAVSLCIAAFGIPLTTATTGLRGILEAYGAFRIANVLRLALGVANFGLPALCVVWFGPSLVWMIVSLVGARLLVLVGHWLAVNRLLPAEWQRTPFSRAQLSKLFSFGAWMTVSNIVGPLMVTADRFVIAAVLGAQVVAFYTVPSEMLMRMLILPTALTTVLFPQLAALLVGDRAAAARLYRKCLGWIAVTMTPFCLAIALSSHWGLSLWLGAPFADQSWLVVVILTVGIWVNSIAFVPFAAVQASGQVQRIAKIHVMELLFYVPLLVYSVKQFGLTGAAVAWVVRVAVDLVFMLHAAHHAGLNSRDNTVLASDVVSHKLKL